MLQQIGNTRSNKQIKLNDLRYITYASCLNFFHTNSMFYPWSFGICYAVNYTWVKRINNNSYSRQGAWTTAERKSSISPETMHCFFCPQSTKTLAEVLQEDQDLICYKDEDERLVITCYYYKTENYNKSLLGFYILEPSHNPKTGIISRHKLTKIMDEKIIITNKSKQKTAIYHILDLLRK